MKFSGSKIRRTALAYTFLLPTLVILGMFMFYPIFRAFLLSFWQYTPLSPDNRFVGISNYTQLFSDAEFWGALKNSFLYLLVVPVIIILSLGLSLLVEPKIPFINFFRACYYLPVVTMMVVVALVWSKIFETDFGLLNTFLRRLGFLGQNQSIPWLTSKKLALFTVMSVTAWKGLGYYMVIFIAGLRSIPPQLIEASMIDGCKPHQTLFHVKIPMLWPYITLVGIISSISALQVFEEIYIMTRGQVGTSTLVFHIYDTGIWIQQGGEQEMGYACSMGVLFFFIIFAFSLLNYRIMRRFHTTETG